MVRNIFLALDDEKFVKLLRIKGEKTWERLLVDDLLAGHNMDGGNGDKQ